MSSRSSMMTAATIAGLLCCAGCERETRPPSPPAAASLLPGGAVAGGRNAGTPVPAVAVAPLPPMANRYEDLAYAVNQGKRLYRSYNCAGCHGQGGGGIGPALMDNRWRYGAAPANVFESIAHGRPGGMPAFGAHVPAEQLWQLTAYVRSLSGQLKADVAPSRADALQAAPPEGRREREVPQPEVADPPEPRK